MHSLETSVINNARSNTVVMLYQITSESLTSSGKNWHILTKEICGSIPTDFVKNKIFQHFLAEICSVTSWELQVVSGSWPFVAKGPSHVSHGLYVATTFGLCAVLLRQQLNED